MYFSSRLRTVLILVVTIILISLFVIGTNTAYADDFNMSGTFVRICGTSFDDDYGWTGDFDEELRQPVRLIDSEDPSGTEYTWEQISGNGELSGGIRTSGTYLRFSAVKAGDVTLRLKAISNGEVLRTVTKSYHIIDPSETYAYKVRSVFGNGWGSKGSRSDVHGSDLADYHMEPGCSFIVDITTFADIIGTSDEQYGKNLNINSDANFLREAFTWSQSGDGKISGTDATEKEGELAYKFECVKTGNVTITFKSNGGKWSDKLSFKIDNPSGYIYVDSYSGPTRKALLGTTFTDYYDYNEYDEYGFNGDEHALIKDTDPAGTTYTWKKVSGDGELSGGTVTDSRYLKFKAEKLGDITIRLEAVYNGNTLRSILRSYHIIEPYGLFDYYCTSIYGPNGGTEGGIDLTSKKYADYLIPESIFTINIQTWVENDEEYYGFSVDPDPTKDDFTWTQSGEGRVEEVKTSKANGDISYGFKCIKPGKVKITFSTKDGKWSDSLPINIKVDTSDMPTFIFNTSFVSSLKKSYSGGNISFYLVDDAGEDYEVEAVLGKKVKNGETASLESIIRCVSSDESIAVPSTCVWKKTAESESGYGVEGKVSLRIKKAGTIKLSFVDGKYGFAKLCKDIEVKITKKGLEKCRKNWKKDLSIKGLKQYGDTSLKVYGAQEGDKVELSYGGKKYKKTATWEKYVEFKGLPVKKTGTKGKVTIRRFGDSLKVTKTVKITDTEASLNIGNVKSNSGKLVVTLKSAKKGDVIKIKAGNNKYSKKVSKNKATFKYTQKIKKLKKGTKINISVYNKFGQLRLKETVKVK